MAPVFCRFMIGMAYLLARKAPSRLTDTQRCQSLRSMSSTDAVGPAIPAFAHKVSSRPQVLSISPKSCFTPASSAASTSLVRQELGRPAMALESTSVTHTLAPASVNASAMA